MTDEKKMAKVKDIVKSDKNNKDKKSDVDIFIPKEYWVEIEGEKFKVERYSIEDMVNFSRELIDIAMSVAGRPDVDLKNLSAGDAAALLLPELNRLVGILAKAIGKDREWLLKKRDIEGFSNLLKIVCEINNFEMIIQNFRVSWSRLKGQKAASAK